MNNPNWNYNFNSQHYTQTQAQQYEHSQQKEMYNATKAFQDFLDAIEKLDPAHMQIVINSLLFEIFYRKQ